MRRYTRKEWVFAEGMNEVDRQDRDKKAEIEAGLCEVDRDLKFLTGDIEVQEKLGAVVRKAILEALEKAPEEVANVRIVYDKWE